ncbi:MAG TPA: hypothetical protein VFS58_08410 [Steroidobacteraceae bacterium]|nr:hypothetical protein [Steroidobacteraceae bacterium]
MITGLVDHLWQSCCCSGVACAFSWLLRGNAAVFRLWLWRMAVLKLLLPFSLLAALGGWLGFPSPHAADPAPATLLRLLAELTPIASPARTGTWTGIPLAIAAFAALAATAVCAHGLRNRLRIENTRVAEEAARRERNVDDIVARPGFLKSALLTASLLCSIAIPLLAGAVQDRQQRRERLIANSLALRNAPIDMKPAAAGLGARYRVEATPHGVSIRNASIHDLVAMVYGVRRHAVISPQMMSEAEPASRSWLHWPRYDVSVQAPVPDSRDFEPYALRQGLTRLLSERFGLEIYVNGDCQPPCGNYHLALAENPL